MSKNFNPLVSIIIPVYNGSNYMCEAIDSALAQTYENIEIIVVNDGSTDDTEEIAKSYGDKIRYYKKENGGVATALNLAIKKSQGEYISWLSHDDLYYEDKIEKQIEVLQDLDEESMSQTIIWSNYSLVNEKTELISTQSFQKLHGEKKLNYPIYPIIKGLIHGCTLLIPKKCFEKIGYFDENLKTTQDYDLWFKMFPKYKLIFSENVFVKSRCHDEQGSKTIITTGEEADELWINMIKNLSIEQKIEIEGSTIRFYEKTLIIVSEANYLGAKKYLEKLIDEYKNRDISNIKVSVIIPFFNRIKWTLEAIDSVISQTHENIEIILINDISTVDISKIEDFIKNDEKIKLINNTVKGASGARNAGINIATGEFIAFLDSDDLYEKNKIEKQLRIMVRKGYLFTHTSYTLFSENLQIINSGDLDYVFPDIIKSCTIATPTVMIHRDIFYDKNIRFQEYFFGGEDICLWIDISRSERLFGIEESLTKVRNHGSNFAYDNLKQIEGLSNILSYVSVHYLNKNTIEYFSILNNKIVGNLNEATKIEENQMKSIALEENAITSPKKKRDVKLVVDDLKKNNDYNKTLYSVSKSKIRHKLKKIIWTISPTFRMLEGNKNRMNQLFKKIDRLELKLDTKTKSLENSIDTKTKSLENSIDTKTKSLENSINWLKKEYSIEKNDVDVNLLNELRYISEDHKSKTIKYTCSDVKFFEKMKEYILKTDIILDIGPGIRPQTFFIPKVHICIEPFDQYRDVIKPFFPNQSHFIFMKDGGFDGMQALDDNSVDTVFMIDLIEHLEKKDGMELLKEADRVSRRQIVVFTPLGFYPMHFKEEGQKDAWGLDGVDVQEHKSGWMPEDFGESWDFHICVDCHEAFLPEEKKVGKRYSALMAIKTKKFDGFPVSSETPNFVKDVFTERIINGHSEE